MQIRKNLAISETGFIFDPTTGDSYTLNKIAHEIILMLKNGQTDDEISMQMIQKYDVDKAVFDKYFYDFTTMLKQMQLTD
jgi:hypothetical protein